MISETKTITEEYVLRDEHRLVTITFKDGVLTSTEDFGLNRAYTLEDWAFIVLVGQRLLALVQVMQGRKDINYYSQDNEEVKK